MGIRERIAGQVAQWSLEAPGRRRTLAAWAGELEASGPPIEARAAAATDAGKAAAVLCHVTGIEAWGQSRLRVFLGAPLHMDEYDLYVPDADLGLPALCAAFAATRAATVALARQLAQVSIADDQTVHHNSFGPLTARGWLAYLDSHATREASRIK